MTKIYKIDETLKNLARIGKEIQEEREESLLSELSYLEKVFFEPLDNYIREEYFRFQNKFSHNRFKPIESKCFEFLLKLKYSFRFNRYIEHNYFDKQFLHFMFEFDSKRDTFKMTKDLIKFLAISRRRYERCR